MFNFLSMAGTYEERKVDRFEDGDLLVSTCEVTDSEQTFETAVAHPLYNEGSIVIVEMYNSHKKAVMGHKKWVTKMTAKKLPKKLRDVSTAGVAFLCDIVAPEDNNWRERKRDGGNDGY